MTSLAFRPSVASIACAVILGIGPLEKDAELQDRQRPVFRGEVSSVAVDVSVRRRNAPVLGLGPDDFHLTDNDVVQRIDSVAIEAVPVDLSILFDVSGSTFGWIGQFRQNAAEVAALLAPTDRFRIVCFGKDVREVVPMQTPDEPIRFGRWPYFGGTALYDALFLAMLHNSGRDRRHLIVVFTDGNDTTSLVDAPDVTNAAARSDATVHLIQAPPYRGNPVTLFLGPDGQGGQDVSLPRPTRSPLPSPVERIVAASGGDVVRAARIGTLCSARTLRTSRATSRAGELPIPIFPPLLTNGCDA